MAHIKDRLGQNVESFFNVDCSCIDCDACCWLSPSIYGREGGQSVV